jgi:CheY-like chemotaxis protein
VPKVQAGEGELAQVILNLLTNAAHAIPEGSPDAHEITIRTSVEDDQVVIEVTDDGSGIAPELQARVFEPFFSTKPVGKGMGLGLSISRDMVSAFGGSISLRSDLGKGTTFRVTLPSAAPSAAETGSDGASGPAPSTLCRRVLVIDDEAMIANLVRQMLSDCQVETVTDPRAGVVRAVEGLHDVVLCDLHMPEMGGMAVYGAIRRQRPHGGPAFVLMTGAAIDDDVEAFLATENVSVLLKPFTIIDLKDRVHHASGSVK